MVPLMLLIIEIMFTCFAHCHLTLIILMLYLRGPLAFQVMSSCRANYTAEHIERRAKDILAPL